MKHIQQRHLTFSALLTLACMLSLAPILLGSHPHHGDHQPQDFETCGLVGSGIVENTRIKAPISAGNREQSKNLQLHSIGTRNTFDQKASIDSELKFFEAQFDESVPEAYVAPAIYALEIWEYYLNSDTPVKVRFSWDAIAASNVLAQARPTDFEVGEPVDETLVLFEPASIHNRKYNEDAEVGAEIQITINAAQSHLFYIGTDGECPSNQYDLVSILLHEIGHGLGFVGSARQTSTKDAGIIGYDYVNSRLILNYDEYLVSAYGHALSDPTHFRNPSPELQKAVTNGVLTFQGPLTLAANQDQPAFLYAPSTFEQGSSVSHLDEITYPAGNQASLMTPFIGFGEVIHDPGPLTIAMLRDIGWDHVWILHTEHKDTEHPEEEIKLEVTIQSDSSLSETPILYFRKRGAGEEFKSIGMTRVGSTETFHAIIEPDSQSKTQTIEYYFEVKGSEERIFRRPNLLEEDPFTVSIGKDVTPPTIDHSPKPFFLQSGNDLEIPFTVSDNLGVAEVTINMWIDGVNYTPEINSDLNSGNYIAIVPEEKLRGHRQITYNIEASDASDNRNSSAAPFYGSYVTTLEPMGQSVEAFGESFDQGAYGFVLNGFTVQNTGGFSSAYLGSPHPYPVVYGENPPITATIRHPISVTQTSVLAYEEIVMVEPGMAGSIYGESAFNDYANVEFSKDGGQTWQSLVPGYDSSANSLWLNQYESSIDSFQNSTAPANESFYITRSIPLISNSTIQPGDSILIRLALYSDESINGWGWAIDNFRITTTE